MFNTLYKRSHVVAVTVVAAILMTATGAVALTHERASVTPAASTVDAPLLGRFVVTSDTCEFVPASRVAGR